MMFGPTNGEHSSEAGHATTSGRFSSLRRLWVVLRARVAIARLERATVPSEPFPRVLFAVAFLIYFWVGFEIQRRDAFTPWNLFFNADCPRVVQDMTQSLSGVPSENVPIAHPFFALFTNPIVAALGYVFRDSGNLPARLLCHASASLAAVLAYLVFRALGAPRWLAGTAASLYAISCSELVLGSIIESFPFVSLALAAGVLVALRSTNPLGNAFAQVTAFGMNTSLVPHTLLCAPVLWFPRLRFKQWVLRTLLFFALVVVLAVALAKIQEWAYPGVGFFFQKNAANAYGGYWSVPKTRAAIVHRATRLVPHFFAFAVVAPQPFLTDPPDRITTFMWEQKDAVAHYDALGAKVAAAWCLLFAIATLSNVRSLIVGSPELRARVVLFAGWLFGTFGFFMIFGDDLLLYSPMWTFHLVAWVVLGLVPLVQALGPRALWLRFTGFALVGALAVSNATFVQRMLSHY